MAEKEKDEAKSSLADPEEEVKGNWAKVVLLQFAKIQVDLPEVPVVTGEEDEDLIFKMKAKLFRFRDGQWKERGTGDMKFLRDKKTRQIRLLMRQDKTLKIVANHYFNDKPYCELIPMAGSDKALVWIANDFSEGKGSVDKLAARFSTLERNSLANKYCQYSTLSRRTSTRLAILTSTLN